MKTTLQIISLVLILAANIIFVGNVHFSDWHCGSDDKCFEIWNMNLMSLAFACMAIASIIPYKTYFTYILFLNIALYTIYDAWERANFIYEFRMHDVYAIMLCPVLSSIIVLLYYIYEIKPNDKGHD